MEQENEQKINTNCGIYLITNLVNGKQYVGQSINIQRRWYEHKNIKTDYAISSALVEYGIENFKFEIIENCLPEFLDEKEIYYINLYNTKAPNGYNLTYGGSQGLRYDYKAIYKKWLEGYCCQELQDLFNCNDKVVHNALLSYNISQEEIYSRGNKEKSKKIVAFNIKDKQPLKIFDSIKSAVEYFNIKNSYNGIEKALKNSFINKFQGYYWSYYNDNIILVKELTNEQFLSYQEISNNKIKMTSEIKEKLSIKNRKVERPNREEFKNLIRNKTFVEIGKIFKVYPTTIANWCDYYQLPRHKRKIDKMSDEEWDKI